MEEPLLLYAITDKRGIERLKELCENFLLIQVHAYGGRFRQPLAYNERPARG